MSNRDLKDISSVHLNMSDIEDAMKVFIETKENERLIGMAVSDEMTTSLNTLFTLNGNSYNYTF